LTGILVSCTVRTFLLTYHHPFFSAKYFPTVKEITMKRSMLALPGIFAALVLLLTWGIFTTSADSSPVVATREPVSVSNGDSQIDPGWQWILEEIDPYKTFDDMTDRSLARDAAGHPHLAYGQNHLYYTWHDGSNWRFRW
jgi:hypothetical protein